MHKKRSIILNTAIAFAFLVIFFRLTDLMIFKNAFFSERAKIQQVKAEDIQVRRGGIYDRMGRAFAVNVDLESLYCDPGMAEIPRGSVASLSRILGQESRAVSAKLVQDRRFVWMERRLSPEKADAVRKLGLQGCGFITEAKRYYPKGGLGAHVVGTVGGENQPLEGIELKYNKYLRTSGGKIYLARDARGMLLSDGVDLEAEGNDVYLTIDEGIQYIVEQELAQAMATTRAVSASAIMMDPYTGEILALANSPAYDLNAISSARRADVRNRAITDIYEPGSTFKIIVGTAAIETRAVRPDERFDVSKGSIEVGGKTMRDAHKHDILTFPEVIQKSSNVGTIMVGMRLGKERIYDYAKRFGFGDKTGIDLPGEISGWIRKPGDWSATSIGAVSIGQEVAATPLQVLRAYAVIANGGYLVTPHVVADVRSPEGKVTYAFQEQERKQVINEQTARIFRNILKTVVDEGGTAQQAAIDGNQVAGKTGTAQLIDERTRRYSHDRFISSFVGFAPADDPRFILIIVIREPKGEIYGGVIAGPVFRSIAEQTLSYMSVPRDDMKEQNLLLVKNR